MSLLHEVVRQRLATCRLDAKRGALDAITGIAECIADAAEAGERWDLVGQARAAEAMAWHGLALTAWAGPDRVARVVESALR